MKNYIFYLLAFTLVFASCTPQRKIVYFQDQLPGKSDKDSLAILQNMELKINSGDLLAILVQSVNAEALPFLTPSEDSRSLNDNRSPYEKGYLVDKFGNIEMLLIGKIQVSGLTLQEVRELLRTKFKEYIDNPLVSVKRYEFKFTVLGEFNKPGTYSLTQERVTLTDAIGLAGDLTSYGNRTNIKIMRVNERESKTIMVDMTSNDAFDPEKMFLKPGDVIYVEPIRRKALANISPALTTITSIVSVTILMITVAVNLSK